MDVLLFTHDPDYATAAVAAGVHAIVVDWEWSGKAERQAGRDTQINQGTDRDLATIRRAVGERVICRINNAPGRSHDECRRAVALGASEVWLPMVRSVAQVEACLRSLDGGARLGIMAETREALRLGREFDQLPLARVYIGLHDYRIDSGNPGLFDPLVDGTIDRFREHYRGGFAVAGVTHPAGGRPLPQRLLLAAMVRLEATFGVARRAFSADLPAHALPDGLTAIRREVGRLTARPASEVAADHAALAAAMAGCIDPPEPAGALACAP